VLSLSLGNTQAVGVTDQFFLPPRRQSFSV
jgi:hypothetical protein